MAESIDKPKPGGSMGVTISFALFVVAGWIVFVYFTLAGPDGLAGAWISVRALPFMVQLLMWLLLLPWMLALWIANTGWPAWLRVMLIVGLAWATYFMSVPPLLQGVRGR